nr:hypothetical protein [Tanacetum cinerariifolium]
MLDSKAYKEYYTVASGAEPPKAKIKLNSKAKVTKPALKKQPTKKTKAKGLAVLSEVTLSEVEQVKLVTKKSKTYFHILLASGLEVPDVPLYEFESDKESWGDSDDEDNDNDDDDDNEDDAESDDHDDDDDKEDVDEGVRTASHYEFNDEEKLDDDEEDDDVLKELYKDVNVNLENSDVEITDANPKDNETASLMETLAPNATEILELTFGFTTTTHPLPMFFSPLLQQQTPTIPTPTYKNPIVTLPEIANFTSYPASKMKEAMNVVDSTMKNIIKNQVKEQVCKFMPNIEKYVTESLRAEVLVRLTNQPRTAYAVVASLLEFELKKVLINKKKDEDPSTGSDRGTKRRKYVKDAASSKDLRSKEKKPSRTSKNAFQSQPKSFGKSVYTKEPRHTVEELGMQQDQEFITGATLNNLLTKRRRIMAVTKLKIKKMYDYGHLEEIENYCHSKAGGRSSIRCRKLPKEAQSRKPDTYRSNLRNKTAYTSHSDPYGIIYKKRARVMVQEIDKQLYQRRLIRNLEKFVGGRHYGKTYSW